MAASSSIIANITTAITNGPSATTKANAISGTGPIVGYVSCMNLALLKFQEAKTLLTILKSDTAAGDTANLALINGILATLNGTSNPSTALLTDIGTVYSTGPGATTLANAISATGPIMDYLGNVWGVKRLLQEAKNLITILHSVTSGSDDSTNQGLLADILTALA